METISIKDIIVPLRASATAGKNATLLEAARAPEKAQ